MSSLKPMQQSISSFPMFDQLKDLIRHIETVVVGAGAGLSASAGLTYDKERFHQYFSDYEDRYGFHDMYSGGFYPYPTPEEFWAYWSRNILVNRYDQVPGKPYRHLIQLLREKDYFVITTNVDHQFQMAGFDKARLFYTQEIMDFGNAQCLATRKPTTMNLPSGRWLPCKDFKIPLDLLPVCPICGAPMVKNLRVDASFVEDAQWHQANPIAFIERTTDKPVLFLELGVGWNTPGHQAPVLAIDCKIKLPSMSASIGTKPGFRRSSRSARSSSTGISVKPWLIYSSLILNRIPKETEKNAK